VLGALFLFGGPTQWLMGFFINSIGDYLWNVIPMGFWTAATPGEAAWQGGGTIFYWGWWIYCAPFVGMFIAHISRGRTIREFMVGAMFVPTTNAFFLALHLRRQCPPYGTQRHRRCRHGGRI
jgi:choline/glycine/proline betaine transport protein